MSAEAVQSEILEPMQRLFLPPRLMPANDQAGALREYVAALQIFDATELNTAWCAVRDAHTVRSWPTPAAFVNAAREARKYQRALVPVSGAQVEGEIIPENQRWDVWKAIRRSQLGREAVRMSVAWALKCAVLNDGTKPEKIDLRELRLGKNSAERTAGMIERGEPIEFKGRRLELSEANASLALKMWRNLLRQETETQAEINFGVRT